MADVFISYAREDQEFVRKLQEALEEHDRNTWVDWEDIPLTAKWKEEVFSAIENADSYAAVISPDFIVSEPCREELDHAALNHKRMVPLWHRDVADEEIPPDLAAHQYVYLRESDDFEDAFERLLEALDTDMEWVHFHTRLLSGAKEWDKGGRDSSFLLWGKTLEEAERWQAKEAEKEPKLTSLQKEYILASRQAETDLQRRQTKLHRTLLGAGALVLMVVMVLGAISFWQWGVARSNEKKARMQANIALSRNLLAQASEVQESQPDVSLLLNVEAWRRAPATAKATAKEEARFALLGKLDQPYHVSTRLGHTDSVNGVAFSPDGELLASASADGRVRLWDVATGEPHGEPLTGHTDSVVDVEFSPDGNLVASASYDKTVRLWDVATGEPRGEPLTGHTDQVYDVEFSPDGELLASASLGARVRLWDVATGEPHGEPLTGHTDSGSTVEFSPDGKLLATTSWADNMVRLWDVATGEPHGEPLTGHTDSVNTVEFSPDGNLVASASTDKTVRLWDVASGKPRGEPLTGHTDRVFDMAFSPDGDLLATASADNTARLWEVASRQPLGQPLTRHTDAVYGLALSPDGKLLASASYGMVQLWEVASRQPQGEPITGHTHWVTAVAYSPDGELLASASDDKTVRLWDVQSGKQRGEPLTGHKGAVSGVEFSPDGKLLASTSYDKTVRLWDVQSGKQRGEPLTGHTHLVTDVGFSPDGKLLATAGGGSSDSRLYLWDVASDKPQGEPLIGHSATVSGVAFSPDGELLATASDDSTVRLWDVASGSEHGEPLTGHIGEVTAVAYSPDGELLASAGADNTVRLWDVATGEPRGEPLTGHTDQVNDVEFSSDGKLLASAGDKTVRLWDIEVESSIAEACTTANRDLSKDEWNRFAGPAFNYVRTCSSLPADYGAQVYVTDEFKPAFRFELGKDWEFAAPETTNELFIWTVSEGHSLIFSNPRHVFDPSNPSEPKELPAPENAEEWVSWLERHPNLDTSKPVPVSVGGASGKRIDVTYASTPENYPRDFCGEEPCVPLYPTGESAIVSYDDWKDRFIILDVGRETVLINVAAPTDEFDAFSRKAQETLNTIEWKEE